MKYDAQIAEMIADIIHYAAAVCFYKIEQKSEMPLCRVDIKGLEMSRYGYLCLRDILYLANLIHRKQKEKHGEKPAKCKLLLFLTSQNVIGKESKHHKEPHHEHVAVETEDSEAVCTFIKREAHKRGDQNRNQKKDERAGKYLEGAQVSPPRFLYPLLHGEY